MSATGRRCAFLSTDDLAGFVVYDELAIPPLARRGWSVDSVPWRSRSVDWNDYEVVVIRSPWDYSSAPAAFLEVLDTIDASSARLENALSVVRWNLEKTYLRDLQRRGVRIVPTLWLEEWEHPSVEAAFETLAVDELVLKPVVGANAEDTYRLHRVEFAAQAPVLAARFAGRPLMAQPFVRGVSSEGELSLFFFGGDYSHAVRKLPKSGDFRVQEEHGGIISAYRPGTELVAAAGAALACVDVPLLYARADFVTYDGAFALMELELVEPSLYFDQDVRSPERFAEALDRLMSARPEGTRPG